jgi:hypothetical protein
MTAMFTLLYLISDKVSLYSKKYERNSQNEITEPGDYQLAARRNTVQLCVMKKIVAM